MSLTLAATAAALAAWLLQPARRWAGPARPGGRPIHDVRRLGRLGPVAVVVAGGVAAAPVLRPAPHLFVVAITVGLVAWAGVVLVRRTRRRSRQAARRREVVDLCDGLVAELRAGQPPGRALDWVARSWPELEHASALARMGGDVPLAMRQAAGQPGAEPFAQVAAGWQVAHRTGASLADVLDRLSRSLRADEDVRREVSASLGPTRATGRLLALLPLFGLGLGVTMGADPVSVLLGTTFGSLCLAIGAGLAVSGLFWVERIADRADPW
jgi:tight adherence protein B